MLRKFHRWPALIAAVFMIVLALSGSVLAVFPAIERAGAPAAAQEQTVAELAALVVAAHPGVEQIKRSPSGKIRVWWFDGNTPGAASVDPATGKDIGPADGSAVQQWFTTLHRSLFLGDTGRIVMATAAAAMMTLTLSGAVMVARRVGGWRHWFARLRGPLASRWHTEVARLVVPVLLLCTVTAIWMTASTFDLLPTDEAMPAYPMEVSNLVGMPVADIEALQAVPVSDLRDLTFPMDGDATDMYTLTTAAGEGYIDQGNGALLSWATPGVWTRVWEWIYLLHTGQGAYVWGLILGLLVMSVPVLAVTGIVSWYNAQRGRPRLRGVVTAGRADTVILVASEGGTTWGFAATLCQALQAQGQSVHVAKLSQFAPSRYQKARQLLVLAATWGDGEAPATARSAVERMSEMQPSVPVAFLGFGDRSFPEFCGFARQLEAVARKQGWSLLMPTGFVDRQSAQDFARWGRELGQVLGLPLELNHQPTPPRTCDLTLVAKRDYGETVQAHAAILRFSLPKQSVWQKISRRGFAGFQAGDLLGVIPEGADLPRFYSLASSARDGYVEIAVRKHPGGLCSGQLTSLEVGQTVQAFVRANPEFKLDKKKAPVILIGAGTGVGPLVGFIRAQGARRPMHLWFGARHPDTDFLYGDDLHEWSEHGQVTGLNTAFSRCGQRHYVQDAIRRDAQQFRELVAQGARILVCGGRDMGEGVRDAIAEVLAPVGLTPVSLKKQGRYCEDVY